MKFEYFSVWSRFSAPTRPALGPTQPPIKWVPSLFPRGKSSEAWCWSPTPSSAEVKERVELYLYSPLGLRGLFKGELYHRSDCRHTLMYAYTVSRTVLTCDISAGPLTSILLQQCTYSRNNFKFRHDFHSQLLQLHNSNSENCVTSTGNT
jgi:hypothetical protein